MKPEIKDLVSGYEFTWADLKLTIAVNHIRLHSSDNRVTGELFITSSLPEVAGKPIHPYTNFNFTAETPRANLIKSLTNLYPQWDWQTIINQLCLSIVDRVRAGEPVKELWTSEDIKRPEFLLEPILYKNLPTIIFGEKAVWKSGLSIALYICLTLPWHDNLLGWTAPDHSVKTLLCDYEADYDIVQYNAKCLQEGMHLPPFPIYYRRCSMPLVNELEQIQKHLATLKAEAIIIDSLGPAVGGDLKEPGQALQFTTALRQLKCASLVIGQTSKERENKYKSVFGSAFFEYYARNIFELRKVQEEGEETINIALFNTYNNLGKRTHPLGYTLNFNEDKITIEHNPITAPELIERMGTQARVLDLLKRGPMTPKEISDILELRRNTVDQACRRLKAKNKLIKVDDKWGLLAEED